MRIHCRSGLSGWRRRLRANYANYAEFKTYAEMYGLHTRLGYRTTAEAWKANPLVGGSTNPCDFRRVAQ